MYYDMKQSGERIRQLRIQNRYTQEELTRILDIDRSYYSRIESGKKEGLWICLSDFLIVSKYLWIILS